MKSDVSQINSNQIISVNEILRILNDYNIGKKPLSKLLGWGETTIIRFLDGDSPTLEYSNRLKAIVGDPSFYYNILVSNKDNITNVAYRKSKHAVLEKLMESKIRLVAQYMIKLTNGEIGVYNIQWLLYYAQAFSLSLYNKPLFEDDYQVSNDFVPYPELFQIMKNHGIRVLELPQDRLTIDEMRLIQNIINSFGWYGFKFFQILISDERASLTITLSEDNKKIISKNTLRYYFKEINLLYGIHNIQEISKYPDKKMIEIKTRINNKK